MMVEKQSKTPAAKNSPKSKRDQGKQEPKPRTVRQTPSPSIDLASISAVQLARPAREQVWALARTQLKIAAIEACQGAEGNARRAQPAGDASLFLDHQSA